MKKGGPVGSYFVTVEEEGGAGPFPSVGGGESGRRGDRGLFCGEDGKGASEGRRPKTGRCCEFPFYLRGGEGNHLFCKRGRGTVQRSRGDCVYSSGEEKRKKIKRRKTRKPSLLVKGTEAPKEFGGRKKKGGLIFSTFAKKGSNLP